MNAKFLKITHPKAAIIMAMTEHERPDLSQSPLQCSLVTEKYQGPSLDSPHTATKGGPTEKI